ncbi:FAD-dependent oxidoreductase [Sphaerisporangium rubeum]|uniref:3-(3-hydroxy-phenyl)propionate hydroxylase n=1 Tax=Sphaerisporangium rubeum TaxID=321317 RepID=A0A7X0IAE9_9ACTN|nr:3-(3-hydroxy-phenyl)propionate hydroxylase [Sphaerisporangium rubeum]
MEAEVVVVGGGPTGLMLACELRLAGVDVLVLERRGSRETGESRAGGMHARTMEVLDQRGWLAPFLAQGRAMPGAHFSALPLDLSGFATRYPYLLMLLQTRIEKLLEERALELGVRLRRPVEVVGLRQDDGGVDVQVVYGERQDDGGSVQGEAGGIDSRRHEGEWIRGRYLVGCDGGRSAVRKLAGVGFSGTEATLTALLGDVELAEPPAWPMFQERYEHGTVGVLSFEPGWYRVITTEYDRVARRDEPVTLETLRQACLKIAGTDFGMRRPRWLSRFGDAARQVDRYRVGRVLLAGDAAHVHFPAGGQGLNLGVQDAVNLGWKLAAVVRGEVSDGLLDTYHAERHPVGARVLHNTRAQSALSRPDAQTGALRELMADVLRAGEVNDLLGGMVSALDVRYPSAGHVLAGCRMPDVDLLRGEGGAPEPAFALLRSGRGVVLDLGGLGDVDVAGWGDRVELVRARGTARTWGIPGVGRVAAPGAVLIRPDGHIAWAADGTVTDVEGLREALTVWFGAPVSVMAG